MSKSISNMAKYLIVAGVLFFLVALAAEPPVTTGPPRAVPPDPIDTIAEQAPLAQQQRDDLRAQIRDMEQRIVELREQLADCQGAVKLPTILWAQPDFDPTLSQSDLPIKPIDIAYQGLLDRDYTSHYRCDAVRDPIEPRRVLGVVFKDRAVTLLDGHSYELCLKSPNIYRAIVSPSGYYPKGTPLLLDQPIWDFKLAITNRRAFLYDYRVDTAKFTAWLEKLEDPAFIGLNHEQCRPLGLPEHPDHQQCLATFVQEVVTARQRWPKAQITHYSPPWGMNSDLWPDAFTSLRRERDVNAYQQIYQATDFLGNDLYAHRFYTDDNGDGERIAKEWMAWNLDTWLMAAEKAGGKDVGVWMMIRVEFNAAQVPNAVIPQDELTDRLRFMMEHEYNGDRIDYIVIWHITRNDVLDRKIVNAIRVAAGLPELVAPQPTGETSQAHGGGR